jgi:membrane-associated protein
VGAVAWSASVILLGSWLGHFDIIANNIDLIAVAMVLISVIPWGIEYLKSRKNKRTSGEPAEEPGNQPVEELITEE